MKRFHVHVGVADLDQSIRFYSRLFGAEPSVRKLDYAKWMIDDPRLNFAISSRGGPQGVNHLGLQVDDATELVDLREHFAAADAASVVDQPGANCCYAKSDKHWVTDPQGIPWEGYHTLDSIRFFSSDAPSEAAVPSGGCCSAEPAPVSANATACCAPVAAPISFRNRPAA
jgi:catechol 2,3-dioxygenase-like lactoylglutathione lyase family enzyme